MLLIRTCSLFLALALALGGCGGAAPQEEVGEALGVDCSAGELVSEEDSHGGFHGDGLSCVQLRFPDDSFLDEIRGRLGWDPLPMEEGAAALAYGVTREGDGWVEQQGPFLTRDGETILPEAEKGWYYFLDRHREAGEDPYDPAPVLGRASLNFTLALYDEETRTLWYCEMDT